MLIWVAALHCEAKPIIDFYHLKKSQSHHAFDLYQQGNIECVVSGMGKNASAAATAWVAALNHDSRSIAWINIGTAGSAQHDIGTALLIHKITDEEPGRHFYPVPSINSEFEPAHCHTRNQPGIDYHPEQLYDMEASAFFDTASRFSSAELVQVVKVVSDNPSYQTGKNKVAISELINRHIQPLARLALDLQAINESIARLEIEASDWQKFLACARFSQTQKVQLKNSLRFLINQGCQADAIATEVSELNSARRIIAYLENLCAQRSHNL
jgi:hypothetical protein